MDIGSAPFEIFGMTDLTSCLPDILWAVIMTRVFSSMPTKTVVMFIYPFLIQFPRIGQALKRSRK